MLLFPGAPPALRQALQKLLEAQGAKNGWFNWGVEGLEGSGCSGLLLGKASSFTDTAGDLAFKEGTKAVVHLGALQDRGGGEAAVSPVLLL